MGQSACQLTGGKYPRLGSEFSQECNRSPFHGGQPSLEVARYGESTVLFPFEVEGFRQRFVRVA